MRTWLERHQVALYVSALAVGAATGLLSPAVAGPSAAAINPILGLVLYATFLGVPMARLRQSFRDRRFLLVLVVVNFAVAPAIVFALSRLVAHDDALLVGVLFVLLTPCVDYVIVFAGVAGGARERLLAATPLLMLAQLLLLPLWLWLFVGPEFAAAVEPAPFVHAFAWLIALPLAAAALTQFAATRARWAAALERVVAGAMVPLMMLTLAVVVASQIAEVGAQRMRLLLAVPVYILYAAAMVPIGMAASRVARLDTPGGRAVVFSGVTRNSLVVLPLALALPAAYDLAALAVMTQTLVELLAMVVLVRLVPRLLPAQGVPTPRPSD